MKKWYREVVSSLVERLLFSAMIENAVLNVVQKIQDEELSVFCRI
jgi:hypothetical protein